MSETYEAFEPQARELIRGAWDLHAHPLPSHFTRSLDDFEFARMCDEYGMAGAMLKSHYDPTPGRAWLTNKYSGAKAVMYGGVALNRPVGGLNPYQVECALRMGGIIVWMPTRDAANIMKKGGKATDWLQRPPVDVVDGNGALLPEVYAVFEAVKKYNAYLATGHLSAAEADLVCREGIAHGVNMILTHPDSKTNPMDLEGQVALAQLGVLVEKVWDNVLNGYVTAAEMARRIRAIGAEHCFMTTDNGQKDKLPPIGMLHFIEAMLEQGLSEAEITAMVRTNPQKIIDARAAAGL